MGKIYRIVGYSLKWQLRATLLQDILSCKPGYQGGAERGMVSRSVENERVEGENDVPQD